MFAEVWCPHCNRKLRVQQNFLGKSVRCPACTKVFVAEDIPVVEPAAPAPRPAAAPGRPPGRAVPPPLPRQVPADPAAFAPQPLPVPRAAAPAAPPLLPATGPQRYPHAPHPTGPNGPPADFPPVEFRAVVKTDPDKLLKGVFMARVTAEGLRLRQGRKHDLLLPVGTPARYLEGNRLTIELEGREVTFTVVKFGAYQARLARDVAAFLAGRKRALYRQDYPLEWYLFLPAVLPLGIPIITLGGALPCALGFGLAGGCLAVAQLDRLSKGARIAISVTLSLVGYAILAVLLLLVFKDRWGWGRRAEAQVPAVAQDWAPPAQQEWGEKRAPGFPPIDDNAMIKPLLPFLEKPPFEEKKEEKKPLLESRLLQIPGAKVPFARFSPDGKVLVTSGDDKEVRFWDPATGKQLGSAPGQAYAEFKRDGKRVLLGDGQAVRQWDLAVGKVLPEAFEGQGFALSDDGRKLVLFTGKDKIPGSPKTVHCYDLASGKLEGTWQTPPGMTTGVGLSPDGRSVALPFFPDRLDVHDAATGAFRVRCHLQVPGAVIGPVYAPGGKTLAASANLSSVITLFDATKGHALRTFDEPSRRMPWKLAFSPDGKKLASGTLHGVLRVWDLGTGQSLAELKVDDAADAGKPGLDHAIWDVQISPDGRYLAATAAGMVRVWEAGPLLQVAANDLRPTGALPPNPNFNPRPEELARAAPKEAAPPAPKENINPPPKDAANPPPKERPKEGLKPPQGLPTALAPAATIQLPLYTHPRAVAFSPDGKLLALGGDAGPALWDVATRTELARLQTQRITNLSVAFSDDGKLLAAGDIGGTVKIWDVEGRREQRRLQLGRNFILGLRFLPGGHTLAIGSDGLVFRDLDTDKQRSFPFPQTRLIDSLAVSPEGKVAACGSFRGEVRLWDVASGAELGNLKAHKGVVFALAFSPDGRTLASGGGDRKLRLWDVATRAEVAALDGHVDAISSLAYTPDGKLLVAGAGGVRAGPGRSGELKAWDVAGRRVAADLRGHTSGVTAVSVSPDGGTAVSAAMDNTLRLWDLTRVPGGARD
jgi:WD40 repeat protein